MRKIIVQEFITLDGVMQAPGGPEEDPSENFKYGGWTAPFHSGDDAGAAKFMKKWMESTDIILGRKTYDLFSEYWPKHADIWPGIQDVKKYVMSNTLTENKSDWKNVSFLSSVEDIRKLKEPDGGDFRVHGSGNLVQTLLKNDLIDELWLITYPITLGSGKRLFGGGTIAAAWELIDSVVAPNGVIFASYQRAGEVKTGTVGE
jgi:dihydrofolate reductase